MRLTYLCKPFTDKISNRLILMLRLLTLVLCATNQYGKITDFTERCPKQLKAV